ncbi:hypothetical protein ACFYE2_13050 [Kocuria sp. CPCC 205300]|uniref:hypothetical protein n=1 Tax=Kocuria sabuli TaxID=3071448 RepID=UPI0036DF6D77
MSTMESRRVTGWIGAGLLALPVAGLLTAWSTIGAQPDQTTDPEAWARFVTSKAYMLGHVLGSTGGTILAIFATFALGVHLATSRAGGLAVPAMVITVAGHTLLLVPAAISTFVTPAVGQAYLDGTPEVMRITFPDEMTVAFLLGLLFALVGNVLLGVAVWCSQTLPRGAGALWILATVVFYLLGVVLGQATTGSSLPTQTIGAVMAAVAGGWIAWSVLRRRPHGTAASSVQSTA